MYNYRKHPKMQFQNSGRTKSGIRGLRESTPREILEHQAESLVGGWPHAKTVDGRGVHAKTRRRKGGSGWEGAIHGILENFAS